MSRKESVSTRVAATAGLMLATLTNALDNTIANVALPHVQGSLSASQDQITWVLTSYMVGTAIMTPLSGWLAEKVGRKRLFLISILGFVAVSVLCGLATSLPEMVVFRLMQGLAGAAMIPISQAAILDLWPQPVIPQVMAIWSAVVMVAPILGPTLGGFLTENYSWRWVFYINVPVGGVGFALVHFFLDRDRPGRPRSFDVLAFTALAIFTAAFQLMMDRGPTLDWFDSTEIWIEAILSACSLYVFIMQIATSEHPLFHHDLFRDANYISALIFSVVVFGTLFSTSALLPTLMQNLLGYSVMQSGLASVPRGLGSLAALAFVPWIARRFGPRRTMAVGLALSGLALWRMAGFDLGMDSRPIVVAGVIQGVGQGLIMNPMSVISFATLPSERRTEAAVFGNMVRGVAGSLGISSLQMVLVRQSAAAHAGLASRLVTTDPVVNWSLQQVMGGASANLEAVNGEVTRQAAMIGYDTAFEWMSLGTLLVLPLLFIMRSGKPQSSTFTDVH
jgi:DHA2 family multidrug resistance protein